MKVTETALPGVLLVEPEVHADGRGRFVELYHADRYARLGIGPFVQDNFSRSARGVVRGLHYQEPNAQGKLVQVLSGTIFDVAVDIRRGSPTFGRHLALELGEDGRQIFIPPGFAHGFCALSEGAAILYKCTTFYAPGCDRALAWNDPELGIAWPVAAPQLSPRDAAAPRLADHPILPAYDNR